MSALAVEVRGAAFKYGERCIFDALDLDVSVGEVVTILGPNGCGKSTLLRCIGGVHGLARGVIRVDGEDISRLHAAARARKLGILFQDHVPTFPFTVLDVAGMGRAPHLSLFGAPGARDLALAEAALEQVGMLGFKSHPYTELSGGERQLVLLARTLVQQPNIILLDEPTAHLDFRNQVRCLQAIAALAAQGVTMIMTSHDPNHAFLFAGRTVLMSSGGALTVGKASDIITDAALSALYGIDMRVLEVSAVDGSGSRVCLPAATTGGHVS